MSPFKRAAVKGGSNKGKELVINVDDLSPRPERTRSPSWVYNPNKFRSYAVFQTYEKYFREATPQVERAVHQPSLHDTNIPIWFATKDWNYLLSDLDDVYINMVKEFGFFPLSKSPCSNTKSSFSPSPLHQYSRKGMGFVSLTIHFTFLAVYLLDCVSLLISIYLNMGIWSSGEIVVWSLAVLLWYTALRVQCVLVTHTHSHCHDCNLNLMILGIFPSVMIWD